MTQQEIISGLNEVLQELGFSEVQSFEHQVPLKKLLSMDSLDYVEFLMKAEKLFGITIPDEAANEIETFEQMVQLVQDRRSIPITGYHAKLL